MTQIATGWIPFSVFGTRLELPVKDMKRTLCDTISTPYRVRTKRNLVISLQTLNVGSWLTSTTKHFWYKNTNSSETSCDIRIFWWFWRRLSVLNPPNIFIDAMKDKQEDLKRHNSGWNVYSTFLNQAGQKKFRCPRKGLREKIFLNIFIIHSKHFAFSDFLNPPTNSS